MKKPLSLRKAQPAKPASLNGSESLIGKGCRFEGKLACVGMLRIEGECVGTVTVLGALVIAYGARVEAEIVADDVIVAGSAKGKITARHSVTLASTARVKADISARRFALEDGGLYSGAVSGIADDSGAIAPQY